MDKQLVLRLLELQACETTCRQIGYAEEALEEVPWASQRPGCEGAGIEGDLAATERQPQGPRRQGVNLRCFSFC